MYREKFYRLNPAQRRLGKYISFSYLIVHISHGNLHKFWFHFYTHNWYHARKYFDPGLHVYSNNQDFRADFPQKVGLKILNLVVRL